MFSDNGITIIWEMTSAILGVEAYAETIIPSFGTGRSKHCTQSIMSDLHRKK